MKEVIETAKRAKDASRILAVTSTERKNAALSEIANELGISRQGVHDLIKRCNKILDGYEEKLRLVQKFITAKEKVNEIHMLTKEYKANNDAGLITKIEEISNEILEEF